MDLEKYFMFDLSIQNQVLLWTEISPAHLKD